jgi:hypothetical protein
VCHCPCSTPLSFLPRAARPNRLRDCRSQILFSITGSRQKRLPTTNARDARRLDRASSVALLSLLLLYLCCTSNVSPGFRSEVHIPLLDSSTCCDAASFAHVSQTGCVKVPDLFAFPIDNFQFGGKSYFLRGMVIHHGARLESGHYTACCRCNLTGASENKWYMFDDSRVSPVSEAELQTMQPYILFYCESSLTRK